MIGPAPIAAGTKPLRELGETLHRPRARRRPAASPPRARPAPRRRRRRPTARRPRAGRRAAAACSARARNGPAQGAGLLAGGLERAAAGGDAGERRARTARRPAPKRLADGQREDRGRQPRPGSSAFAPCCPAPEQGPARARRARRPSSKRRPRAIPRCGRRREQERTLARVLASERDEVQAPARNRDRAQRRPQPASSPAARGSKTGSGSSPEPREGLTGGLERLGSAAPSASPPGSPPCTAAPARCSSGLAERLPALPPAEARAARAPASGSRRVAGPLAEGARRLRRSSPGLFDSGYFVLSALDGAPPGRRAARRRGDQRRRRRPGGADARRLRPTPSTPPARAPVGELLDADAERLGARRRPGDRASPAAPRPSTTTARRPRRGSRW